MFCSLVVLLGSSATHLLLVNPSTSPVRVIPTTSVTVLPLVLLTPPLALDPTLALDMMLRSSKLEPLSKAPRARKVPLPRVPLLKALAPNK